MWAIQLHRRWARWVHQPDRPNRTASIVNRFCQVVASAGLWPRRLATLEVRRRRGTGAVCLPVVIADVDSERYLVAMLGERTSWVATVRDSGGFALLHHGQIEAIRLRELPVAQRAPILQRYFRLAPGVPAHVRASGPAGPAELNLLAAGYPVFRIEPAVSRTPSRPDSAERGKTP